MAYFYLYGVFFTLLYWYLYLIQYVYIYYCRPCLDISPFWEIFQINIVPLTHEVHESCITLVLQERNNYNNKTGIKCDNLNLNQIVLNAFGTNDVKDLFYPHLILRMFWDIYIVIGTHVMEYFSISAGPKVFDIWLYVLKD